MRWLRLSASFCFLVLLASCNAPTTAPYITKLSILSPWDNQADGKPIYNRLDTHLTLSYLLADSALVDANNIYQGKARFRLVLNGIDITEKQRKAICGTEVFSKGYTPPDPTLDEKNDPVACSARLKSILDQGYRLQSVGYTDGFFVRNVGSGGEVEFIDLQSIEPALISGINTLTLISEKNASETSAVEFIFFGQPPQLQVSEIQANGIGQDYKVILKVVGDTPIKQLDYNDEKGRHDYAIAFSDHGKKALPDGAVSILEGGREIHVDLRDYPDVTQGRADHADMYYTLTDSAGIEQSQGLILSGHKLDDFLRLQLNQSMFNALEPVINPMINSLATIFIDGFDLLNLDGFEPADPSKEVKPGDWIYPKLENQIVDTEGFRKMACDSLLTNTLPVVGQKECVFYATIDPVKVGDELSTDVRVIEGDSDKNVAPKLGFDVRIPNLKVNINITAFDSKTPDFDRGAYKGRYLGSYKTTINFKDLALRETFALSKSDNALIEGLNKGEGYSMLHGNDLIQKLREMLLNDPNNAPTLSNSSCDICILPANFIELATNMGGLASQFGLIEAMEEGLNAVLPDVFSALLESFPDVNDIKKTASENASEQIVATRDGVDLVRNMTATYVGVKDMNLLGLGFAPDTAGMLRFSGGYKAIEQTSGQLKGADLMVPFVDANGFGDLNTFNWGRYIFVENKDGSGSHKEQVDLVVSINANAINQYIAGEYQLTGLSDWLNESFKVDIDSTDLKIKTLSRMVTQFDRVIEQDDDVELLFDFSESPKLSFIGGKESLWAYSYDLLFGLLKGGESDTQVTPAIKLSFNNANIKLNKVNGSSVKVFDVDASFSIEANIAFENGIPKLYVKTPQAPRAQYEDAAENRLDKRLVIDISKINQIHSNIPNDQALIDGLEDGVPNDPFSASLKVLISSAFVGVYQEQIRAFTEDNGTERFFDELMTNFLRKNFSKVVKFTDDAIKIPLGDQSLEFTFRQLFGRYPVFIQGHTKWFTTDETGSWLNVGLDLSHKKLERNMDCPINPNDGLPEKPFTLCYQ